VADYALLPQNLNLQFIRGDEFWFTVDADIDLTGYQFSSSIYKVTNITNGIVTGTQEVAQFTITPVDLTAGKINLSLQESQTLALSTTDSLRWFFRWVGPGVVTRTVLSGSLTPGDA
jgi:hypothetical protein